MISRLAEWLLTYFVHSTVLLCLVAGLVRLTRDESALERLWRIGLLGPVLSTTLLFIAPAVIGPVFSHGGGVGTLAAGRQILLVPNQEGWSGAGMFSAVVGLWAGGAVVGLVLLVLGHWRLARLLRGRTQAAHFPETRVFVAPGLRTPIALLSGELCLPPAALQRLSTDELNAVLAHEQEHVRRRDPLWLLVYAVLCRVLFFQPLNWIAAKRLRGIAEFLCDRAAAGRTSPVAVASALAQVSAWIGQERVMAAGMASAESLTLTRVKRILSGESRQSSTGKMVPVAGAFLLGLTLLGPGVALERAGLGVPYTISAYDDGGPFTVTIDRGQVTSVTMNGVPVPATAIEQDGNTVRVLETNHAPLLLTLTPDGGMHWTSRPTRIAPD